MYVLSKEKHKQNCIFSNPVQILLYKMVVFTTHRSLHRCIYHKYTSNGSCQSRISGVHRDAWKADTANDNNPWIQVNCQVRSRSVTVNELLTQGRNGNKQWVETFQVRFSDDGHQWIKDEKVCYFVRRFDLFSF